MKTITDVLSGRQPIIDVGDYDIAVRKDGKEFRIYRGYGNKLSKCEYYIVQPGDPLSREYFDSDGRLLPMYWILDRIRLEQKLQES